MPSVVRCALCGGAVGAADHVVPAACMMRLAWGFPSLDRADGVHPWTPTDFDAWVCGPEVTDAARHAGAFVLAVWCGRARHHYRVPPFDILDAMAVWDRHHRSWFVEWAARPWWP